MLKLIDEIKNIDISIIKIMNTGFKFSFVFLLIGTYILQLYIVNPMSHIGFYVGYSITKCGIMFFVCFFIGAFVSDKIIKRIK